jgi:hypothetical protein
MTCNKGYTQYKFSIQFLEARLNHSFDGQHFQHRVFAHWTRQNWAKTFVSTPSLPSILKKLVKGKRINLQNQEVHFTFL